jgi:hypothetical protein
VLERTWAGDEQRLTAEEAVQQAVAELSDVEEIADEVGGDLLRDFLTSPEAASCVRLLFVARVHASDATTEELRAAFVRAFERTLPGIDSRHPERLFGALASSAERTLEVATRTGDPAAGHALETVRFRKLSEELAGLRLALESLQRTENDDISAALEWESRFRPQVIARHGTIIPPTFDAVERVPIEDIYVESSFRVPATADALEHVLSSQQLAARIDRTVVLGDPGAGKSTFAQKLAYDLARSAASVPGGALVPLLITLKDYGAAKQDGHVSLLEWIEIVVNSDYATPAPADAIDYLLTAGRAMVIFDGLDELLDTSYRREITADIETFAARYVAAPLLVTSRRVGYDQAPLDPRRFATVQLSELNDAQVEQYSTRWFALRREMTSDERKRMAQDFLRDSAEAAGDLRRNTLMLALLCNIYRGDGYIPRKRPQVYEKCAVMLFERWDRGRRIVVPLEFERHLRPAIQHLAFWIYSDARLRAGVSERELIRSATEFLTDRRFDDEDEARTEAMRFIEFCRGRAWVFSDTGVAPDGEHIYQFTHRTFLEYFAAEHLVRTHRTPADLAAVLRPRIQSGEWDVVAQLAFQLQDDNIDGAGDELLSDLLAHAVGKSADVTLSFAARSLSFLVPRRTTCREVASAVTRRTWSWLTGSVPGDVTMTVSPADTHAALACVDRENFDPVARALAEQTLALLAEHEGVAAAEAALEIAANTDVATWELPTDEASLRWPPACAAAFEAMWPLISRHVADSRSVAYDAFSFGALPLAELACLHPIETLFDSRDFRLYHGYAQGDVVKTILDGQLGGTRSSGAPVGTREELETLGRVLFATEPPWHKRAVVHSGLHHRFEGAELQRIRDPELDGAALFGAFAALAVTAERSWYAAQIDELLVSIEGIGGWIALLQPWLRRRFALDAPKPRAEQLPLDDAMARAVTEWGEARWSAVTGPKAPRLYQVQPS